MKRLNYPRLTLVALVPLCLALGWRQGSIEQGQKGALSEWKEIVRCGRIEISEPGSRVAMILEAREGGARIRIRNAEGKDRPEEWDIELSSEFMMGARMLMRDRIERPEGEMGARVFLGLDDRKPAAPFLEIRDATGQARIELRGWGPGEDFASIIIRDEFGRTILKDSSD